MVAGCAYCTAGRTAFARAKGMTDAMYGELLAIVGMTAETNRLASILRVPLKPALRG
jgi:alkylhydroperoxidase family enzyme